ncbi:MAG: CAP domain-containing protein [Planctomycetota bacterium]
MKTIGFLSCVLGVAMSLPAYAQGAPVSIPIRTGVLGATELGYQGYADGIEHPIEGQSFEAYGHEITLDRNGAQPTVTVAGKATKIARFPWILKLGSGGEARAIEIVSHGERLMWTSHWGATFQLDQQPFAVIDADGDGVLWEIGEDAIIGPDSSTATRYTGGAWTTKGGWTLAPDGPRLRASAIALSCPPEMHKAWCRFNVERQAAGCQPVAWDEELARGCRAHVAYLARNDVRGHDEDPSKPGFTEIGRTAAKQSVLGYQYADPLEAIIEQFRTAYHLENVMKPGLLSSAMAIQGTHFACNTEGGKSESVQSGSVAWVWPAHGRRDAFRVFNAGGEQPMPVPGHEKDYQMTLGQVVCAKVTPGKWDLVVETAAGQRIEGVLTFPGKGIAGKPDNDELVILAPAASLPVGMLRATLSRDGAIERRWWFATR